MKFLPAFAALAFASALSGIAEEAPSPISLWAAVPAPIPGALEWQDPVVFGVNKLPPRAPAWPNPDAASGWKSDYDHSPWVQSLDGDWAFHWV
ncbi:MAG TPA: hypothetical protein VIM58_01960, partial [Candidatus Methylacidiphilales bacterium]